MHAMNDDWTSASFRAALVEMVRRRVPPGDADDVVQAALTEAVASRDRPTEPEAARKWIWGVARHKISDYYRRARREVGDLPEQSVPATQEAERDLLRWAVGELPDGSDAQRTFAWLLREGEGETLEDIAAEESLPAPQVRQRVSRMRKLFRSRWAQLAMAGLVALVVYVAVQRARTEAPVAHRDPPRVTEAPEVIAARARSRVLRDEGARACGEAQWQACLDLLDQARALDPAGDDTPAIRELRLRAHDALDQAPVPLVTPYDGGVTDGDTPDAPTRRTGRTGRTRAMSMGSGES